MNIHRTNKRFRLMSEFRLDHCHYEAGLQQNATGPYRSILNDPSLSRPELDAEKFESNGRFVWPSRSRYSSSNIRPHLWQCLRFLRRKFHH